MFDHSLPACAFFFFSGDKLAHTNSTLYARISLQWLSELRRLWPNVPRHVRFQIGSHAMPGQRYSHQPTPTSLGQGCIRFGV